MMTANVSECMSVRAYRNARVLTSKLLEESALRVVTVGKRTASMIWHSRKASRGLSDHHGSGLLARLLPFEVSLQSIEEQTIMRNGEPGTVNNQAARPYYAPHQTYQ